jgi:uncharacterized protein
MNTSITPKSLIDKFNLLPHPEGGFFKENYRSAEIVLKSTLPRRFNGDRSYSTAIYFLLEKGNFSAFHKISSDECWHFYAGSTLLIYIIHLNGKLEIIKLGNNLNDGERFQAIVPAECWFASEPATGSDFCFVGCTVAPGFDFGDFKLAQKDELSKHYPQHKLLINRLTR